MTAPRQTKDHFFRAFLALIAVAALVSFNIWYTARNQRVADARWCELVVSFDDRYRALVNPAPEAIELANTFANLRKGLKCEPPRAVVPDPTSRPLPSRS